MKLVSWNVNGIRACVKKGFLDYFEQVHADIFCIQESKLQEGQIELDLKGYHQYWNYAERKGYSGTAIFTRKEPISVHYGVGDRDDEPEGRIITLEFEDFYLVNVYTPNSKRDLSRLPYRLTWEDEMRTYLCELDARKPVIFTGDLNVARAEIDLKNPKSNIGNSGFTDEEREKIATLLSSGFVDSFRYLNPNRTDSYTWWSYMSGVRAKNIGWRIDYFLVSEQLISNIVEAEIDSNILGSDHCPIILEMKNIK